MHEHLGRRVGSLAADHETAIAATMALSIQRLDADAQAMLRALACLAPVPIPISLIAHDMGGDAEAIRVCEEVADQLERASLARIGSDSTVTLHRVVQLVAQQVLGVTAEQVVTVHESVAAAIFATLVEMRGAAVAGPYRHCFELARTLRLDVDGETYISLEYWQGWYLGLSGQYAEASERLERLLNLLIPAVGDADEAVLQVAFAWAGVLARLGRIDDSTTVRESILEKRLAAGGPSDPLTIIAMVELSGSYSESGRYQEAIELGEAALSSWAETGSDLLDVAQVRSRLGSLYLRAGDPERAIPHAEAFLAWADSVGGAGHPDALATAAELADAYAGVGRFDEAIAMMTTVAQSMAEVHGAQHPETLIAIGVLAGIYMAAGRADDSVAVFQSIDAAMLEVFGPEHRETLVHRGNMAEASRLVGDVDVAIDQQEALIVQAEAVFGAEHPEVMTMHTQLGSMYLDAERVDDAVREYERAYHGRQAAQGRDNPETLISAINLVFALWTGGREDDAVALAQETVRLAEAAGGHPDLESWRAFLVRATGG
ncbi:MAG: tetratricopeptide repeat protein [Ilumatobacteraceae bacterium]